jgi:hypothetical protein
MERQRVCLTMADRYSHFYSMTALYSKAKESRVFWFLIGTATGANEPLRDLVSVFF